MTLQEILKDKPDVLSAVNEAIKANGAKFVDLTEGKYVDAKKYSDLETKHNDTIAQHEAKIKEIEDGNKTALQSERDKISAVVKSMAIDNEVNKLNLKDKLAVQGIKGLINANEIQLDENYKVVSGLDNQIEEIKNTYKDSFVTPTSVSTGQTLPTSKTVEVARQYTQADIDNMSVDEIIADLANINSQLGTK